VSGLIGRPSRDYTIRHGNFLAEWYNPATGGQLGLTHVTATNGQLLLPLPDFTEDLAGFLCNPPTLTPLAPSISNHFLFKLNSEIGGRYLVQLSYDLSSWTPMLTITNTTGTDLVAAPFNSTNPHSFFRAQKLP